MTKNTKELEARFLEIDTEQIKKKLKELGANDLGEDVLYEIIFYDKALTWKSERRFVRLRKTRNGTFLSYKHKPKKESLDMEEVEILVDDWKKTKLLLERTGLVAYREQEKRRHTFRLGEVICDIDTWPSVPSYLEIEGETEKAIKTTAESLGLSWNNAVFYGAGYILEHFYTIPVMSLHAFTFDRVE